MNGPDSKMHKCNSTYPLLFRRKDFGEKLGYIVAREIWLLGGKHKFYKGNSFTRENTLGTFYNSNTNKIEIRKVVCYIGISIKNRPLQIRLKDSLILFFHVECVKVNTLLRDCSPDKQVDTKI